MVPRGRRAAWPRSLQPLAALYGWVATVRYGRATPYRSRLPVICVGNFTAGGTGKTPLALHICEHLKAAGHEPVALTRGYGGGLPGPYWVNAADKARDVGDEALLLARVAPTLVARDRRAGARAIETGPHPATVIVMDDGLQNPRLAKDLSIAVVDGVRGLGNGMVIPAGPLRAPLDFQLELTDAIVVNERWARRPPRPNGCAIASTDRCCARPPFRPRTRAGSRGSASWPGPASAHRSASLPCSAALGADVLERVAFRDHQRLGEADAVRCCWRASARRRLVTTEKDMARLAGANGPCGRFAIAPRAPTICLAFAEPDAGRLTRPSSTALQRRGSAKVATSPLPLEGGGWNATDLDRPRICAP